MQEPEDTTKYLLQESNMNNKNRRRDDAVGQKTSDTLPREPTKLVSPGNRPEATVAAEVAETIHAHHPDCYFHSPSRGLVVRHLNLLSPVSSGVLYATINKTATFVSYGSTEAGDLIEQHHQVFKRYAEILCHTSKDWCRTILGHSHVPIVTASGRIATEPGYDDETQTWLEWPGSPLSLRRMNSRRMRRWLRQILQDFPFDNAVGKWHALAALLTMIMRHSIQGATPMFVVTAPGEGAGKTFLVKVLCAIVLGRVPTIQARDSWSQEADRQLTATLLGQPEVVFFDNLETGSLVGGTSLHRILTADGPVAVRPLGSSTEKLVRPRCTWFATLVGADLDPEMARRTIPITLGWSKKKEFAIPDLVGWVKENRVVLLQALYTMIQDWLDAGRPTPTRTLPSYNEWSDVVGGILCNTFPQVDALWLADEHRPTPKVHGELARLLDEWPTKGTENGHSCKKLKSSAILKEMVDPMELLAIQALIGNGSPQSRCTKLGRYLQEVAASGRSFGGLTLERVRWGRNTTYRPRKVKKPS